MKPKVAVVCYWYDAWPEGHPAMGELYVNRLRNAVARNSTIPHDFIVYVDGTKYRDKVLLKDMDVRPLTIEFEHLRWNLKKLFMFCEDAGLQSYEWVVCLDLDLVVQGNMDFLLAHRWDGLATCSGAYQPGEAGGSIVGFMPKKLWTYRLVDSLREKLWWWDTVTGGSERKFYRIHFGTRLEMLQFWQDQYPGKVLSFKTDDYSTNAGIIRFHGKPRPHDVVEDYPWIRSHWQ